MTDIPYQPGEVTPPADSFRYVPLVAGGLGFMFNLRDLDGNRITQLNLTPELAYRIFTQPGMRWNDAALRAENPSVAFPDAAILPVVRSDTSGTSYVMSQYCISVVPSIWDRFRALMTGTPYDNADLQAGRPTSMWPSPASFSHAVGANLPSYVAGLPGAIGFLEAGFSTVVHLPLAKVRNAAGQFIAPDAPNVTAGLSHAVLQPDGTFQLDFAAVDPDAYFPATYSYALVPLTGVEPGKGRTMAEFINFVLTSGQSLSAPLGYVPLPAELIAADLQTAALIPGAPPNPVPGAAVPEGLPVMFALGLAGGVAAFGLVRRAGKQSAG